MMDNIFLFNEKKLTEATMFFLLKSPHHTINILKLMKLLYLSERKSFEKFYVPIIGDSLVSMKNGPVLSLTLDRINSGSDKKSYWNKYIADRKNHNISIRADSEIHSIDQLNELSNNDLNVVTEIFDLFGNKTQWELVDYTHDHCSEWRDPGSSMYPIEYKDLFKALNFSDDVSNQIITKLEKQIELNKLNN